MFHAFCIGHFKLFELGKKNHDRQPVDEAEHHRMRDETDEFTEFQGARQQLDDAHHDHGGKQIFDTVGGHQRHHDDSQRACCT